MRDNTHETNVQQISQESIKKALRAGFSIRDAAEIMGVSIEDIRTYVMLRHNMFPELIIPEVVSRDGDLLGQNIQTHPWLEMKAFQKSAATFRGRADGRLRCE